MSQEDVLDLLSLVDLAVVLPLVIDAKSIDISMWSGEIR